MKKILIISCIAIVCIITTTTVLAINNNKNSDSIISRVKNESIQYDNYNGLESIKQEISETSQEVKITKEEAINISNIYAQKIAKINLEKINIENVYNIIENNSNENIQTFSNSALNSNNNEMNVIKNNAEGIVMWYQKNENYYSRIDAKTGELVLLHFNIGNFNESTKSQSEVINIANNLYKELELDNNFEIYSTSQFDDATWIIMFAEKVNGIFNPYNNIKLTILPEDGIIESISMNEEICENNIVSINEETAEKIAINMLKNKGYEVENTETELAIRRANLFWESNNNNIFPESSIIRNVWEVKCKTDKNIDFLVYVDATTSEIVGGDAYV